MGNLKNILSKLSDEKQKYYLAGLLSGVYGENVEEYKEIVELASRISSGLKGTQGKAGNDRLISVFGKVRREEEDTSLELPRKELDLKESGFPVQKNSDTKKFVEKVKKELKNLKLSGAAFLDTALFLLEKYLWSVPLKSKENEESSYISLFHHLKTTAAFAACLWEWGKAKDLNYDMKKIAEERPFLLVVADLSGIQNFIYNIYSSKAKKALKGRSFYLQLLTETLIYEILQKTGFFRGNILFSAGGKFFLLLPNTDKIKETLESYRKDVLKWLWQEHGNSLYLALDWIEFGFYEGEGEIKRIITLSEKNEEMVKNWKTESEEECNKQESDKKESDKKVSDEKPCPEAGNDEKKSDKEKSEEEKSEEEYDECDILKKFVFPKKFNKEKFKEEYKEKITLGDLWWLASEKLGEQKMRRWKILFDEMLKNKKCDENQKGFSFKNVFECAEAGGTHSREEKGKEICAVTGAFAPVREMEVINEAENVYVLKNVYKQIQLGEALAQAKYLIFSKECYIRSIKINQTFVSVTRNVAEKLPKDSLVLKMNDLNFLPSQSDEKIRFQPDVTYGFTFYGGNKHACVKEKKAGEEAEKERVATFEELSQISDSEILFEENQEKDNDCEKQKVREDNNSEDWVVEELAEGKGEDTHIAIFRSDVDNLGSLFIYGFLPNEQSFSLISTMSFMFNWFFAGYLNTLQANRKAYRKHLIIVYSGGDDVFVLGRWDVVFAFARELRREFCKFTGRDDITLSAGLAVVKNKFPIRRAAELAGNFEHNAKSFIAPWKNKEPKKDAVAPFGLPVSWHTAEAEWRWILKQAETLYNALKKEYIGTGFLHKLNSFYVEAERQKKILSECTKKQNKEKGQYHHRADDFIMFLPRLSYDIARMKSSQEEGEEIDEKTKEKNSFLSKISNIYWTGNRILLNKKEENNSREISEETISPQRAFVLHSLAVQIALLYNRHFGKKEKEANQDKTGNG